MVLRMTVAGLGGALILGGAATPPAEAPVDIPTLTVPFTKPAFFLACGTAAAIIAAGAIAAAGSVAAGALAKPDVPVLPPPPEDTGALIQKRKEKIRVSQTAAAQRIAGLGTSQLRAPTLNL